MNYEDMLERAQDRTDQKETENTGRFDLPDPDLSYDRSYTIYKNLGDTAKYIKRDNQEIAEYIKRDIATSAVVDDNTAKFKGEFSKSEIVRVLNEYVKNFILCMHCSSPDTHYQENESEKIIKCDACGQTQPKPSLDS